MSLAPVIEWLGERGLAESGAAVPELDETDSIADGPAEAPTDAVASRLADLLGWCQSFVADPADSRNRRPVGSPVHVAPSDAVRIDRIALLERLQAGLEAVKQAEMVAFARSQAVAQVQCGVSPRLAERGIADQIALACKVSPSEGSRRLRTARDLVLDMPTTFGLLTGGEISGWTARSVVEQLSHLDGGTRKDVDAKLTDQDLAGKSSRKAAATAKRLAYEADPVAALARCSKARKDRRVTLRPAADTMSLLTGLLPVEQGVSCLAALQKEAASRKAAGDERTRGQIMADTLVARLTGQETAEQVPVEIGIIMPIASLIDSDDPTPAEVVGHGPIPAGLAHQLVQNAKGRRWWRRLFTKPVKDSQTVPGGPVALARRNAVPPSDTGTEGNLVKAPEAGKDSTRNSEARGDAARDSRVGSDGTRGVGSAAERDSGAGNDAGPKRCDPPGKSRNVAARDTESGQEAAGGVIVDLDVRRRKFRGAIAELIRWRDQHCRDPYCDAPIRHLDHIQQYRIGGRTTSHNGRGVCERGNQVRELPGWEVRITDPNTHTVTTTTPTGHTYTSRPPQPP